MEDTFDEIKTEVVKITVRVEIEYEKGNEESRKHALKTAKENCLGITTHGYPVSTRPLTAKISS